MVLFSEILSDGKITKIECWIMVAGYLGYILFLMFFDKDKLKEFDEEILIEYSDHHSHVFEHPYNIEDAVSILSHEENGSYGSIRSISRSASPLSSDHDRLSPTIEVPSENQALLFVPGKRPSQTSIDDEDDDGDDNEEVFICVPEEKPSIWERLFDYVDLVFSVFVPCYKPIESNNKKNLVILIEQLYRYSIVDYFIRYWSKWVGDYHEDRGEYPV
ncbi:hypothetical protein G210_0697 [Candida maltosa Xu316]|uniref:Uncharacterized protein n=1 Tax=Candida maltosa (strain Xu316) TaxID=1245528 RepID=M3J9A6_CANMX|nr:hypothetical protein G210_0697 [Candida maltosa Xu316]